MKNTDLQNFTDILLGLAENYPGTNLTPNGLKLRFMALKEYSIEEITRAALTLIQTHRFNSMPNVADFIRAMGKEELSIEDRAEQEAGKVLAFLRLHGRTSSPMFEDPVTARLMSTRWRYQAWASTVKEADLKWWRLEFCRSYVAHSAGIDQGYYLPAMGRLKELSQTIGSSS